MLLPLRGFRAKDALSGTGWSTQSFVKENAMTRALFASAALLLSLPKSANAREEHHSNDEKSVHDIRQPRPDEKRYRINAPEENVVETARVALIVKVHERDTGHH
jgi:hypothetical protein